MGIFVAWQLVVAVGIESWWVSAHHPEYGYRLDSLKQRLAAEPGKPLVLMLGSSRTETGIRPDILKFPDGQPIIFNFGITGTSPLQQLIYLNRLLAEGIRPDLLVLEVLPARLGINGSLDSGNLLWPDLAVLRDYQPDVQYTYLSWLGAQINPLYSNRQGFLGKLAPSWLPRQDKTLLKRIRDVPGLTGWVPWAETPTPEVCSRRAAHARQEYEQDLRHASLGSDARRIWRQMLTLCQQEGIPAVLCLMPEATAFRGWYSSITHGRVADLLGQLHREFDVPVIDARTWMPDCYFIDGHHLLPDGAARFTELLGRALFNEGWITSRQPSPPSPTPGCLAGVRWQLP